MAIKDWFPSAISVGPPLPRFLNIYWPWCKATVHPKFKAGDIVSVTDTPGAGPFEIKGVSYVPTVESLGFYSIGRSGSDMATTVDILVVDSTYRLVTS
jgi:hypothetical protein